MGTLFIRNVADLDSGRVYNRADTKADTTLIQFNPSPCRQLVPKGEDKERALTTRCPPAVAVGTQLVVDSRPVVNLATRR